METETRAKSGPWGPRLRKIGGYRLGRVLGTGASGQVRIGTNRQTGQQVAIKVYNTSTFSTAVGKPPPSGSAVLRGRAQIAAEIEFLRRVRHENVIMVFAAHERRTPERIHLDVKPANIILDEHHTVKLADFGLATLQPLGMFIDKHVGTPYYYSPEIIKYGPFDGKKADVWSAGVVLYKLLTGALPFYGVNEDDLVRKTRMGVYAQPTGFRPDALHILERMLDVHADRRFSMTDVLFHRWLLPALPLTAAAPPPGLPQPAPALTTPMRPPGLVVLPVPPITPTLPPGLFVSPVPVIRPVLPPGLPLPQACAAIRPSDLLLPPGLPPLVPISGERAVTLKPCSGAVARRIGVGLSIDASETTFVNKAARSPDLPLPARIPMSAAFQKAVPAYALQDDQSPPPARLSSPTSRLSGPRSAPTSPTQIVDPRLTRSSPDLERPLMSIATRAAAEALISTAKLRRLTLAVIPGSLPATSYISTGDSSLTPACSAQKAMQRPSALSTSEIHPPQQPSTSTGLYLATLIPAFNPKTSNESSAPLSAFRPPPAVPVAVSTVMRAELPCPGMSPAIIDLSDAGPTDVYTTVDNAGALSRAAVAANSGVGAASLTIPATTAPVPAATNSAINKPLDKIKVFGKKVQSAMCVLFRLTSKSGFRRGNHPEVRQDGPRPVRERRRWWPQARMEAK